MNDVELIKERLDVADVIGGYIQLKPAGRNLKAPCPFHNEKTASFMVSPEKGIWHCFGCNQGGDVIKFVMQYEGLEFRPALELLAKRAGVELRNTGGRQSQQAKQEQDRLRQATTLAAKYFQASLTKNPDALGYIKKRGLKRQTIIDFQIGYAPDDWNALSHFLAKKGFSDSELRAAGLVGQKEGRNTVYDMFRGRLMFTICDAQGSPVGFTGRVLSADQEPKYLNTSQTSLYDKSRTIYGLHLAKEAIRSSNEVVLVEGNMDVVTSHQAGVKQVVAVSGTALTTEQLKALGRLSRNLKICFDADSAGLRATERAIELSQNLNLTLSVISLPESKDPDDLINKDVAAWKQAIVDAQYAIDYLFDALAKQYDITTATGKRHYSDRLSANIRQLADPVEREHYISLLAKRLDTTEDSIREKLDRSTQAGQRSEPFIKPAVTMVVPSARPSKQLLEESVLAINLAYPEVRLSLDDLTPAHFSDPDHQIIVEVLQRAGTAKADVVAQNLPNQSDYVKILSLRGEEEYDSFAPADRSLEAFQLVGRLQTASNKDTQSKLRNKLREAQAKGDTQLVNTLLGQFQSLVSDDE
jgi:DNA primase